MRRLEETQALISSDPRADASSSLHSGALKAVFEGKIDEAIALCRQALNLTPSEEIFQLLSRCYAQKNQLDDALDALHQTVRLAGDQTNYKTYFQLGTLYYKIGQLNHAVKAYRQSIRLNSQEDVRIYHKMDLYGAIQAYQKALELTTGE